MILGVDHIALSCEDISDSVERLGRLGYTAKFVQMDVPNAPEKRGFLTAYRPLHSLAYCRNEQGISVELTQHSAPLHSGVSPYQVLLDGPCHGAMDVAEESASASWGSTWRAALGCRRPAMARWDALRTQLWYDARGGESSSGSIRAVLVPVADVSVSQRFWTEGLGCRAVERGTDEDGRAWAHLAFRAPIRAWSLDLVLAASNYGRTEHYLDDSGFPCLAVISNRVTADKETAREMGAREVSDEFQLEVSNNLLKVVMLRGPGDELVEMIELSN